MYRALDNYGRLKYIERDETFQAISNGSKVGLLGVKYGAHQFRLQPRIGKLKNPICQYPASLRSNADFLFIDAFSRM